MSASQQLRLFIQERLAAAGLEIFGVVEKTISEYELQVVQLVEQLKQGVLQLNTSSTQPHIHLCRIESQPVNEEVPPLQQLMKDETIQHHSPQVIVEQTSLTDLQPVSEEPVSLQEPNPRRQELMSSEAVQQPSPQVKEEQVVLSISIISDSDTSISNSGTNGFVTSETSSDGQPTIPFYPAIANHSVTNIRDIESGGSGLSFSQTDNNNTFGTEQKICSFCGKQCRSYSELVEHVEGSHTSHSCPVCGKCFINRSNFNVHMRTHTAVKPHSLFNDASDLNLHVNTHSGHHCPVCGKMFADRSNLKVHIRIHSGVKPYSCHVCGKLFTQNVNLKVHMRTHTGEKPYFCNKCGKMFSHKSHLKWCRR